MSKLDQAIREALSSEDAELMQRLGGEPPLHVQLLETFQGRLGWLNIVSWIAGFATFGALCFFVSRFNEATGMRDMFIWAGASGVACITLALIKVWAWMELQKNAVLREIKRLELQVARLINQRPA